MAVHHRGVPPFLLGIVTWIYLTDRPAKANWLSASRSVAVPQGWKIDRGEAGGCASHARPGVGSPKY